MSFETMHARLLDIARERVRNGELTESHLARLVGVSQSHIHNVLKGIRKLSAELADEILRELRIDTEDLLGANTPVSALPFRPVPLLSGALGLGMQQFEPERTAGSAQLPAHIVAAVRRPLAVRLGTDTKASPRFENGDLVLVDQSIAARRKIIKHAVYVVSTAEGPRLRYVRPGAGCIYLASENCLSCPSKWTPVPVADSTLLLIVRGRVVWVSRQLERAMAG